LSRALLKGITVGYEDALDRTQSFLCQNIETFGFAESSSIS